MSSNPPTRPALSPEQMRELTRSITEAIGNMRGGANVNVTDPRVTAVQNWILAVVGTGVVGALLWMAQTLSTAVAVQTQHAGTLQDHEQRLRAEERRP